MVKKINSAGGVSEEKVISAIKEKPRFLTNIRFIYRVTWNNIPVGRIIAESKDITKYKGRDVYEVTVTTESNKFLSKIYRVEDKYTSYIDAETMTSVRYEADRKEGNYRKHVIVEYDFDKGEATYTNLTDGTQKKARIPNKVQDPVSTLCYFMTLPLTPGEKLKITVHMSEKNYELFGMVEKINMVKLPDLGSFPAFKIQPYAELNKSRVKKGKAWMYFSADQKRYPLYGGVYIPFGKVLATMNTIEEVKVEI